MTDCGIITGVGDNRQRCTIENLAHRGPHWTIAEPINCECEFRCPGHPEVSDEPDTV